LNLYTVDYYPYGIASDGTNIWVVANGAVPPTVFELQASNGASVGSFPMPTGAGTSGIAFDGRHMWVTNTGNDTVTEL
jgi:hypothetical protein